MKNNKKPPKVPAPDKELKEILEPKVIESAPPHKEEEVSNSRSLDEILQ